MTSASATSIFTFQNGPTIKRLGFGAMRLTGDGIWGEPKNLDEARAVLRRVLELGINFIDTADSYGPDVSERLIGETLAPSGMAARVLLRFVVFCGTIMGMKMYRFTPTAADALGEAGITQAQIAARSGYDRHELNKRINRRGAVRHASASRIAQAYAELARTTREHAMQTLFNEITEDADQQRNALNGSATRGERP